MIYLFQADLPSLEDLLFVGNPLEETLQATEKGYRETVQEKLIKLKKLDGENRFIWASMRENLSSVGWEQQRHRLACTWVQTDQCICYSLTGKCHISTCFKQNFNFLASNSVAEETGLSLALSETLKTGFVASRSI